MGKKLPIPTLRAEEFVVSHAPYCGVCGEETLGRPHGFLAMFKNKGQFVGYRNHCIECLMERLDSDFEGGYLDDEEDEDETSSL